MKTVTLVAYRRLHYLNRVIESLKKNSLTGYSLFVGVEPDDQSVVDYCRNLDFMPTTVVVNENRLGVAWNPHATISRAFAAGSSFNVALEDDVVLSPDALSLANWFFALPYCEKYFSLNLFNYHSDAAFPDEVEESNHFVPLGWAVTTRMWHDLVEPGWMCDQRGWDFSVNRILESNPGLRLLQPRLARANHIGREDGAHCTPAFHDATFSRLPISDGLYRDYHLAISC
jgi:hypothetical protein